MATRIKACVEMMTAYDHHWEEWFRLEEIDPVRLSYDDLSADPTGTLRHILERLGLDPAAADGIEPGVESWPTTPTRIGRRSRFHLEQSIG